MRRRLLLVSLLLALVASGTARAADPVYADPELADELTELLRAEWPNRFSADEEALPADSPVRAALWRARVAAKALPPLARGGEIQAAASGRLDLTVRVTRKTPAGQAIDDRILDFGAAPEVFSLRTSAAATAAPAPYGGAWVWFAGPLGDHPPGYPQLDVWHFYLQTESGRVHAARDMPACVWGTERSPEINCLVVGPNTIAREQALYDSLLAQPIGNVLWNGRYCEPNYFPGFWDPPNKVECLTRITTHDRFVRELPAAYFVDNDGRPVTRSISYTVPPALDLAAAVESLAAETAAEVAKWLEDRLRPDKTLVFVPGVSGSYLSYGVEDRTTIWPQAILFSSVIPLLGLDADGETALPGQTVAATGVLDEAFGFRDIYKPTLARFESWLDRGIISEFVPFAYDWRRGVEQAAQSLAQELAGRCGSGPIWIVTHSFGGLVAKRALQLLPNASDCIGSGGAVLVAAPHLGSPKAIGSIINPDRFFDGYLLQTLVDEFAFARVMNNWLTAWELMPREPIPEHPKARPAWFTDWDDGLGDRNVAGELLNVGLDLKATERARGYYQAPPVRTVNIFGYGRGTPETYEPGRCDRADGRRIIADLDRDAEVGALTNGDGTVPAWSGSWPGAAIPDDAQYAIRGPDHGNLTNDDAVLRLIESIVLSTGTGVFPNWPDPSPNHLRAETALAAVHTGLAPFSATRVCSPARVLASVDGAQAGVGPDGRVVQDIPNAVVDVVGGALGHQRQSLFIPAGTTDPVFELFGTATGRVVIWHTEPDGSQQDFEFMIEFADRATLRKDAGEWRLSIDRAGDGTIDQLLRENHPVVSIRGGGAPLPAAEGTGLALEASAISLSSGDLAFEWELLSGEGTLVGEDETATFTPEDGPATAVIRLTVIDALGKEASADVEVRIENRPPGVDAGVDLSAPWGVAVAFDGRVTDTAADMAAGLSPRWEFGDGSGADGTRQLHTYTEPGEYAATLTATDRDGDAASDTVIVRVLQRNATLRADATEVQYGTRTLAFRVSDDVSPSSARLAGRRLLVTLAGETHHLPVAADGTATLALPLPPAPGAHPLHIELAPDPLYDADPLDLTLRVANGHGAVEGAALYDSSARAAFAVHSDADGPRGQIEYRSPDRIRMHSGSIGGFGIVGGAAWFSGVATDGRRFVARATPGAFGLWIDGVLEPNATVEAGAINVRPG